jgi:hypothetical protein
MSILLVTLFVAITSHEIINYHNGNKKESFLVNEFEFQVEKYDNYLYLGGYSVPSDLLDLVFKKEKIFFEFSINQGRLDYNSEFKYGEDSFSSKNNLFSYPNGLIFHTNDNNEVRTILNILTDVLKITLTPLSDKTGYIKYGENYIISENNEKPCTDHLDAIKEMFPYAKKKDFKKLINYDHFAESDYKSIKFFLKQENNIVKFKFTVIYRLENEISNIKTTDIKINENISSIRYIKGNFNGFDNLIYVHEIDIMNKSDIEIFDVVPCQVDILFHTIKIEGYNKAELKVEEISEKTNNIVPFTYEGKKTTHVRFLLKAAIGKITISYQLRKKILDFESYENENEFGYKYPVGLISINKKNIMLTKHIYFNVPYVDSTMPFNVISLSWVVFGFLFIQTLNLYLGNFNSKGLLESIKDRFMAKWGFLFGK